MSTETREPRCPKCGCTELLQFDLVPIGYLLQEVSADGTFEIDDSFSPRQIDEERRFDGIRCRNTQCEYEGRVVEDFFAWANDRERAESLMKCEVQTLDGHRMVVEEVTERQGKVLVRGVNSNRSAGYVAAPHEVRVLKRPEAG